MNKNHFRFCESTEVPGNYMPFRKKSAFIFKNENNLTNCTFPASSGHYLISSTEERWKVIQTANIQLNARFFSAQAEKG